MYYIKVCILLRTKFLAFYVLEVILNVYYWYFLSSWSPVGVIENVLQCS